MKSLTDCILKILLKIAQIILNGILKICITKVIVDASKVAKRQAK